MPDDLTNDPEPTPDERWRVAVVAALRAQQEYELLLGDPLAADEALDRVWLKLWRAQRDQAELLRTAA